MIVFTLTASGLPALRTQADGLIRRWADVDDSIGRRHRPAFELRLDLQDDPRASLAFLAESPWPVVVTARRTDDLGAWNGEEERRRSLLRRASAMGASFVDVEWPDVWAALSEIGTRRIASVHGVSGGPELDAIATAMEQAGARGKIAAAPTSSASELLAVARARRRFGARVSLFAMGESGVLSRWTTVTDRHGSASLVYVAAGDAPVAPGQLTADAVFRHGPRLCAVSDRDRPFILILGWPTSHTLSPPAFNAALEVTGEPYLYLEMPLEDLGGWGDLLRLGGVVGASVTLPHKGAVIAELDEVEANAARLQAVNTVVVGSDGLLRGANHDIAGVATPLRPHVRPGDRAVVLGAGGAAAAAAAALFELGAEVIVAARRPDAAVAVASVWDGEGVPLEAVVSGVVAGDVLINATPVGGPLQPGISPLPEDALRAYRVVMDMTYRPQRTPLLVAAAAHGATTVSGVEMFIEQSVRQWCDFLPHAESGRDALAEAVRRIVSDS